MSELARLLFPQADHEERPKISHVGQIAMLTEYLGVYQAPNTFKVGDLVTPRRMSNVVGHGEPHIVTEVTNGTGFTWAGTPGECNHGKRLNVRIAFLTPRGYLAACWAEHSELEPFVEATSAPNNIVAPETADAVA